MPQALLTHSCHCISENHKKKWVGKERRDWTRSDSSELATFWHIGSTFSSEPGCPASLWGKWSLSAYARERIEPIVLFILTQKAYSRDKIRKTFILFSLVQNHKAMDFLFDPFTVWCQSKPEHINCENCKTVWEERKKNKSRANYYSNQSNFFILTSTGPGPKRKKIQSKYLGEEASNFLLQAAACICKENTLILAFFLSKGTKTLETKASMMKHVNIPNQFPSFCF